MFATLQVKQSLLMDIAAGVSIGFMVVPQGMSYALLANLPAVYGLYGTFVPVFIYAALGSSRHLAVGPVAVTSLLLGQALRDMIPASEAIQDPNNPGASGAGLDDVQNTYNDAAIQVRTCAGLALIEPHYLRRYHVAD